MAPPGPGVTLLIEVAPGYCARNSNYYVSNSFSTHILIESGPWFIVNQVNQGPLCIKNSPWSLVKKPKYKLPEPHYLSYHVCDWYKPIFSSIIQRQTGCCGVLAITTWATSFWAAQGLLLTGERAQKGPVR